MWLIVPRQPLPDMAEWPGRRWLAVVDAVLWPAIWSFAALRMPAQSGIVGPMVVSLSVLFALRRLHRAVWLNHRYRFTTWRWGKLAFGLIVVGLVLKLLMPH